MTQVVNIWGHLDDHFDIGWCLLMRTDTPCVVGGVSHSCIYIAPDRQMHCLRLWPNMPDPPATPLLTIKYWRKGEAVCLPCLLEWLWGSQASPGIRNQAYLKDRRMVLFRALVTQCFRFYTLTCTNCRWRSPTSFDHSWFCVWLVTESGLTGNHFLSVQVLPQKSTQSL